MRSILKSAGYNLRNPDANSIPNSGASNPLRSVRITFTPEHGCPLYSLDVGVNVTGTNRTPAIPRAFKYAASSFPLIQGAPTNSNGVSVPRPTETFVPSIRATPGYRAASITLRKFGDGFTHTRPVESNQSPRCQPSIGTTVSFALIFRSALNIFASSPMVIPCRTGTVQYPVKLSCPASATGPCTNEPVIGFGRSSTISSIPAL